MQKIPQVIDCNTPARADYVIPEKVATLQSTNTLSKPLSGDL